MNASRRKDILIGAAVLLAPAVSALGARGLAERPGPRRASAAAVAQPAVDGSAASVAAVEPNEPQRRALARGAELRAAPMPASPFLKPEPPEARPERASPARPTPAGPSDPGVRLTSILQTAGGPIAVLNGAPRRVGDTAAPGWTVSEIDPHARTVVLTHTDGGRIVCRLPRG